MVVDSGNIASAANTLDVSMSLMAQMKYDAVGLGNADVRLGADYYKSAAANKICVLDASPFADKSALPYIVKTVGGVKVGIISFGCNPPDKEINEYQLRKARFIAYKAMRAECDVLILLDQAGVVTDQWLGGVISRYGAPDIVIGGISRAALYEDLVVGKTHIMPTCYQAKDLGVVDLEVTPGQALKVTATRTPLDDKYAEDEAVAKKVAAVTQGDARTLHAGGSNSEYEVLNADNPHKQIMKPYYSPMLCKACHLKQYEDWQKTKHAKALATLVDTKNALPECLGCHSELYRQQSKYVTVASGVASGVECESCHMNALPHGMERREMVEKAKVDPQVCLNCHTKDRSPNYDVKTYFPRVVHATSAPSNTAAVPEAGK